MYIDLKPHFSPQGIVLALSLRILSRASFTLHRLETHSWYGEGLTAATPLKHIVASPLRLAWHGSYSLLRVQGITVRHRGMRTAGPFPVLCYPGRLLNHKYHASECMPQPPLPSKCHELDIAKQCQQAENKAL